MAGPGRAGLDAGSGHRGRTAQRLGLGREDRYLAVRPEHQREPAHLDGRLHEAAGRRGLAGYHRRRTTEHKGRFEQRVRRRAGGADLAAVHGRDDRGDEARQGEVAVHRAEVPAADRRAQPGAEPAGESTGRAVSAADLRTAGLPGAAQQNAAATDPFASAYPGGQPAAAAVAVLDARGVPV